MRRRLALVVTRRMFLGALLLVTARHTQACHTVPPWVGLYPAVEAYYRSLGVSSGKIDIVKRYGGVPRALRRERNR